jgi:hypothetical protein
MKTKITLLSIVFISALSFFGKTQTLDQSQLVYNSGMSARNLPGYSEFQSFTAGITGTLVEIDMGVFNAISGVGTLKIYSGTDTTGTLLQSLTVTMTCPSGSCFTNFSTSVSITSGQTYTFRFIPGAGIVDPYGVQAQVPGTYAGGEMGLIDPSGVYYPGFDLVFKTFVSTSLGIVSFDNSNSKSTIYPNPFNTSATIHFSATQKNATLDVFDVCGKKIRTFENISGESFKIERDNLPEGIYFVRLVEDNKVVATEKFVIMK